VTVTVSLPTAVPSVVAGKETMLGVTVTPGRVTGGPLPVPLSSTAWGEPGASSAINIVAVRSPPPIGAKLTLSVQLALTCTAPLQPVGIVKSLGFEPLRAMEEKCSTAAPEFVTVTDCGALVAP
jgi:hypothetical protein